MTRQSVHLDGLMTASGLENHELAAKVGTGRQTIWKLRNGYTRMLPDWARRIAPHLGVSWHELVDGAPRESTVPAAERELLHAFRSTDAQGREMMLRLARSLEHYAPTQREAAE
jgi:DNA-binding XRE family transcriptional regulator